MVRVAVGRDGEIQRADAEAVEEADDRPRGLRFPGVDEHRLPVRED